jgi:hypothetical protein
VLIFGHRFVPICSSGKVKPSIFVEAVSDSLKSRCYLAALRRLVRPGNEMGQRLSECVSDLIGPRIFL